MADVGALQQAEDAFLAAVDLQAASVELKLTRLGLTARALVSGNGPPIVFIHGGSTSGASWAHLAKQLPDFQCILIDRPGCGLSEMYQQIPGSISDKRLNADRLFVDVVDALGLERAHLACTSLGGWFGFRGAAAHPERLGRMVALGFQIGAEVPKMPLWMRWQPPLAVMPKRVRVNRFMMRKALEAFGMKSAFRTGEISQSDEMLEWMVVLMNNTATSWNEMAGSPFPINSSETYHSSELLKKITKPVLFLWGEEDPWAGETEARTMMSSLSGPAELRMIPHAGHAPWLDALDYVAEAMREHLQEESWKES